MPFFLCPALPCHRKFENIVCDFCCPWYVLIANVVSWVKQG